MLNERVSQFLHWIRTLVTEPQTELTRWEKAIRYAYELCLHGWRALQRDNAPQMASALAFRTLFALLPVVVVSTVVVKAVGGAEPFKRLVASVISAFGLNQYEVVPSSTNVAGPTTVAGEQGTQALGPWLQDLIGQAASSDFSALGWIGLAVVVYSAIWTMVTIENSFNAIYGAPEGRPWVQRFVLYWTVLTLGPLFIGITIFIDAKFSLIIENVAAWGWLLTLAKSLWGLTVAWLLMFTIYRLVPNTNVQSRAALIGGLVAALLLQLGKGTLGWYFAHAVSFQNLYGSLGLVPVFMFWVYLMWLVVLFGLEVSATIQSLHGRAFEEVQEKAPHNGLVDPVQVLNVVEVVTERFAQGLATSTREITDQTLIPESMVATMIERLTRHGIVHRVEGAESSVTLARPPEQISADRLIEIGYALVDEGGVGRVSAMVGRLREVQTRLAGQATLASLLPAPKPDVAHEPAT